MIARGRIAVPGDKSITHRALMLAALTDGACRFDGALSAGDTRATASCLSALGITVSPDPVDADDPVLGLRGVEHDGAGQGRGATRGARLDNP